MGYRMPKYLEGPGKIKELGAFLKEKGVNDVLVVTSSGMVRRGQVQPMLDSFEQNGIRYALQNEMFCEEGSLLLNRRLKYADF